MRSSLLLLALLGGCAEPDPTTRSAPAYMGQLEPLLYDNGFLAERMLTAAAAVYNDPSGTGKAKVAWHDEVVPLARHLADQASATTAPVEWTEQHAALVTAWTTRADAYQAIDTAVDQGDRTAWEAAKKKADEAKLKEEAWFTSTNKLLAPVGLRLDQFP